MTATPKPKAGAQSKYRPVPDPLADCTLAEYVARRRAAWTTEPKRKP